MARFSLCVCLLSAALVSCRKSSNVTAQAVEPDCSFETPLVPGIPGSPGHGIISDVNPNGASELATLMRSMLSDMEQAKASLLASQEPQKRTLLSPRHRKIRCSWPTAVSDRNATFDAFAVNYLKALKNFDESVSHRKEAYSQVIQACLTCHENSCDGPIVRIEKLKLPE